ncbi:MAG: glutamate--tRNA ligase [Deltaproteobacteria bacterium]|nr:glutamate--tRNA ligase [Deltaproteobacteria bacterium]
MSSSPESPVRTRFAPSPTGNLHIGNARTAFFNYLFARKENGRFILRIEDTDVNRSLKAHEKSIMDDLKWLGLLWDEGPDIGGGKGPYRQSERLPAYKALAKTLLDKGLAYRCYCGKARLEELKSAQKKAGTPPRYDGRCMELGESEIPVDATPAIRFKVPKKTVRFIDGVHGEVVFDARSFGDFVILGSEGIASYNFAVVADDASMDITHIIRGDDHLSNTPRQILLFDALGFDVPSFSHIPLVLGPDRSPLSKRQSGSSLKELREGGFLPTAVLNATARLGWSPGEGLLSLEEMTKAFSIKALSNSPSVFDAGMLKHFNKIAIEGLEAEDILKLTTIKAVGAERELLLKAVDAVRRNAVTLKDLEEMVFSVAGGAGMTNEAGEVLKERYARDVVAAFIMEAGKKAALDEDAYNDIMAKVREATFESGRRLFLPIRCALTGRTEGAELVKVITLLGKEKVIERLKKSFKGL